jgi:hypothetical protein
MSKTLTPAQLAAAATEAGVTVRGLRAVMAVETGGEGGFLPDGRPRILLERHILWKRLLSRGIDPAPLANARPDLCGPKWLRGGYGPESAQWGRVDAVIAFGDHVDRTESYAKAAWESCSFGLLQVLGVNYPGCGFRNVQSFKAAMEQDEYAQLQASLRFMRKNGALDALAKGQWMRFAGIWNGPGQRVFYAGKLALAYLRSPNA